MREHIMEKLTIRPLNDVSEKLSKRANEHEVRTGTLSALTEKCNRLEAENSKLRQERDHWHVEQVHAYGNWEDAYKYASELESENAKLRDAMYTNAGKHALHHMDEDELRIWATQQAELVDELRELVRIMAYCMHDGRECDECAMNGADMNVEVDQLLACDELYRRIMEVVD